MDCLWHPLGSQKTAKMSGVKGMSDNGIRVQQLRGLTGSETYLLMREINKLTVYANLRALAAESGFRGNPAARVEFMLGVEENYREIDPMLFALLLLRYGMGYRLRDCATMLGWSFRKGDYMIIRAHVALLNREEVKCVGYS